MKKKYAEACGTEWRCKGMPSQPNGPISSKSGLENLDLSKCPRTNLHAKNSL